MKALNRAPYEAGIFVLRDAAIPQATLLSDRRVSTQSGRCPLFVNGFDGLLKRCGRNPEQASVGLTEFQYQENSTAHGKCSKRERA